MLCCNARSPLVSLLIALQHLLPVIESASYDGLHHDTAFSRSPARFRFHHNTTALIGQQEPKTRNFKQFHSALFFLHWIEALIYSKTTVLVKFLLKILYSRESFEILYLSSLESTYCMNCTPQLMIQIRLLALQTGLIPYVPVREMKYFSCLFRRQDWTDSRMVP